MRKNYILAGSITLVAIILFTGCSGGTNTDSVTIDPGEGMQVATLSGNSGSATAAPGEEMGPFILMMDDFSDPSSGWDIYTGEYGRVAYDRGGYLVEATVEGEYNWGVAGVDYADVRIEVDVSVLETAANLNDAFGVDCRIQSNGDGYGFRLSSDGFAGIVKYVDMEGISLLDWTASSAILTDGSVNHITAICEGNHLSMLVNDQFIAEVVDDTYTSGDIALSAITFETEPVTVLFDNFIVQQIDNPYVYADSNTYPFTINNPTRQEICWAFVTSPTNETWGDSWIADGETLAPGESRSFEAIPGPVVDIKIVTCNYQRLYEELGVDLSTQTTLTLEEPPLRKKFEFSSIEGWTEGVVDGGMISNSSSDYYSIATLEGDKLITGFVDFQAADVTLNTDASLARPGGGALSVYGPMCRVQRDGSGIFFAVRADGKGSIQKWSAGKLTPLTDWIASDYINPGVDANYIEAECIGEEYTLHVNAVYVTSVQDSTYNLGKVGFGVLSPPGPSTQVDFDYLEIYDPR
jgi:hypothetical protein